MGIIGNYVREKELEERKRRETDRKKEIKEKLREEERNGQRGNLMQEGRESGKSKNLE